ncbi:unnamed protein product [Dibothriocephalus latus]|uniref:Uncharacterized protein n=1 Tax=Dibothriocephalus latus TaxID=60516 RepID=A0A3P6PAH4_DIBLA|nr:unnamed protein product [Dibothriocephalus latus]
MFIFQLADVDFSQMRDGEQSVRQTKLELKLSQNPLRFGKSASGLISDDDISGRCVTNYEPIQDAEGRVLVRRTKSVSECSRRYASELTPNSADPSLFKALIESRTVSGVQTCDLTPDADGFLSSVECSERLTIDGGFGAGSSQLNRLSMASKLVRLSTTNSGPLTPDKGITFRRTAFAPSPSPVPTAKREYREINEAVELIAVMLRTDNWSGAANFLKLIEILRSFSLEEFSELYSMFAKNNEALYVHSFAIKFFFVFSDLMCLFEKHLRCCIRPRSCDVQSS